MQDDPEEIAARESEQDEENLARRMELISLFAADFKVGVVVVVVLFVGGVVVVVVVVVIIVVWS